MFLRSLSIRRGQQDKGSCELDGLLPQVPTGRGWGKIEAMTKMRPGRRRRRPPIVSSIGSSSVLLTCLLFVTRGNVRVSSIESFSSFTFGTQPGGRGPSFSFSGFPGMPRGDIDNEGYYKVREGNPPRRGGAVPNTRVLRPVSRESSLRDAPLRIFHVAAEAMNARLWCRLVCLTAPHLLSRPARDIF